LTQGGFDYFGKKSTIKKALERGLFDKHVKNYRIFKRDKNRTETCYLADKKPDFLLYLNCYNPVRYYCVLSRSI